MKKIFAILAVAGVLLPINGTAQSLTPNSTDSTIIHSLDQLIESMRQLHVEREVLQYQVQQIDDRMQSFEQLLDSHIDRTAVQRRVMSQEFDSLRSMIPSEEPIRAANLNIIYLNRRQDSMMAYIGRLEDRINELPDQHYWGVRNDFKNFDHLLLFTFLGSMMSLGVVLLVRTGNKSENPLTGKRDENSIESDADRMSIAITLLVGAILVVLFILFIL